jgi:preprotein translocase subunit SecE
MAKAVAVENGQSTGLDRMKAQPRELADFLKDVRAEMRKVVAPAKPEVMSTTFVVVATVFLFAAYFFIVDSVVGKGVTWLIHTLAKH